ncbi:MAG: alpha/beta fold hydrolase [Candidatus Gagatemarchaeaceae archaeon]
MLEFTESAAPRDLVLIHGAGGNSIFWKRTAQFLSGEGRAFALNLPGHPSGDITCRSIAEYADAVHGFIAGAGLSRPFVCGHSMGSAISLELAIRNPDDVGGLILVGAGAKLGVDPAIVDGLRTDPMLTIEKTITPMSYFAIDLGLGREARAALSFSNLPVFLNDYLACDGFDIRDKLSRISGRTLLVCGEKDRMTPPRWTHYLAENIANSSAFIIREAGHMVPLERPESFASLLQGFLV